MNRIVLDESAKNFQHVKSKWVKKAKKATIETLPDFLEELTEKYTHDYGTICHAIATAAIAAAYAMNHSPQGGITGFQAECIMWEFIRSWNYSSNKTGLRIIDYDNFLYPQYADKYDKTISRDTWSALQKNAKEKIEEADKKYAKYQEDVIQYEKDLYAFIERHPDYPNNKEYYEHIMVGTGEDWEKEEQKEKDGFDFAPQAPCRPIDNKSPAYLHWCAIINGIVPFGYKVK